ncbi:alpha/beta hydrolase [filamentous cyanobacterium LEGE 11480]|uniref:Alpha/beta hydrolase n=1 Tax=Romeriopsis navalis LEGE 11480 TaxID=2777977 RepID=A0A928VJB1_9CYAN|nr:alpha/beta hydrolase [Romeriopsis navalis]MBE9028707.1 alpha/beta hydrolase [Romeriopsis navalis LEGE 11480]
MLWMMQLLVILLGAISQGVGCWREDRQAQLGQFVDVNGRQLHLVVRGHADPMQPTIVLDHSLGGVEGYFLIDQLSRLSRTCISDRAGYGWSQRSAKRRTSAQIVQELDTALTEAGLEPPYLLIGDSFGSYNMRLYAHTFPDKVCGLILTDGLHESGMLNMSPLLRGLQAFFISGFLVAILGSTIGAIRLLRWLGLFYWLKPELRQFPQWAFDAATRSFCRPQHWWTMTQELFWMDQSGQELADANDLGDLPIVDIPAASFFIPAWWTRLIPLGRANALRDQMHEKLMQLSTNCKQIAAPESGHFVWIDQPAVMLEAVKWVLEQQNQRD